MRKSTQTISALFLLLLLWSIQSCQNYEDFPEIDDIDTNAELAIPVFHGIVSVEDLIEDVAEDLDELSIEPDGTILLSYEAETIEQGVASLLEPLPNFPVASDRPSITIPFDMMPNYQVKTMELQSGTLAFTASNAETPEDVNITIRLPELKRNGQMFSVNTMLNYNGSMPVQANLPAIDLSGYTLTLENDSMTIEYIATNIQGDPVTITGITGEARNWVPNQITGVWDREEIGGYQDTIEIDLFGEDYIDGEVTFTDPRVEVQIGNSFGVPTRIMFRQIDVITINNDRLSMESAVMNNGIDINYPSIDEIGSIQPTTFTFDKENSNIATLLNAKPAKLVFVVDIVVNPENANTLGFLNEQSKIAIDMDAKLTAEGMVSDFEVIEEFEAEVEADDVEDIDFVEVKFISRNGIPLDVRSQFYFVDEIGQRIDSLFSDGSKTLLAAAQTGASGSAASAPEQITRVMLNREQIDRLITNPSMMSVSSITTTNNGSVPVHINAGQELELKMGLRVKLK